MKSKLSIAVLAATAALATSAAHAASSLTVTLSYPVVTATGGFSWIDQGYGLGANVDDQIGWADGSTPTLAPRQLSYDYGLGTTTTTAAGNTASLTIGPSGYTFFVATGSTGGYAMANLDLYGSFSLAPGATVTFTWNRSISGSNSGQANASPAYDFTNGLVVNTSALFNSDWVGLPSAYATGNVNESAGFSLSGSDVQTLSYTNDTDSLLVTEFRGSVQVYSRDMVAAIPEPEQYAMVLAGLAALAMTGRIGRRRRG